MMQATNCALDRAPRRERARATPFARGQPFVGIRDGILMKYTRAGGRTIDRIRAGARPHPLEVPTTWPKMLDEAEAEFNAQLECQQRGSPAAK